MNGAKDARAGAPLAAHFEAKRRIMATVKQMEERGEKLEEATPEEILEAASKAAETVFKFDFSVSAEDAETSDKKRSRNRKRNKKRRAKKPQSEENEEAASTTERSAVPVTPAPQRGNAKDCNRSASKQQVTNGATANPTGASFLKLRKATGTESEVAKMHLRYGQGRRNLAAIKQREQRKKAAVTTTEEAANSNFKFNFVGTP
ncbi:hypothetical protein JG687_00007653 [Phytophthora cactorum]|uniref:Uncharacterized protein n=1 Tax=Phytophthora cactorum TaxID=29920 RepID=A0A329SWN2_9STRA|nr:hypothetical protein Pcac1_g5261 [Phytophthora cactorum]KAG2833368.1 hypothetical protein PC112_g6530 [Phytophthora cactorum]KAG2835827.1 hypothetical protein PC111_g5292 [Phytophthora cactorum]KAG2862025.1 hypothetical protein PC113_g6702 [Phytophthora cactorum]KAG2918805.1 hypothetical protein PC114_g6719 [Phytophthora cactorum]